MKYCVNCKHYLDGGLGGWCQYDDGDVNPVTGKLKPKFAHGMRNSKFLCGKDGVWFEEKSEPAKISFWKRLFK